MKRYYEAGLIVLIAVLVFANSLSNKFVYDDKHFIVENPAIRSLKNIPAFFTDLNSFSTKGDFYIYRPLSAIAYAMEYRLFKLNPVIFHVLSVAWHVAVCVMLYFTLSLVLKDKSASLLSALLFAVHPAQAESVSWVSQRSNLISLFFFLLALYLWIKESRAPSVACYALALLGKEMAITLPVILILYDVYFPRKDGSDRVGVKRTSYLPFFGAAILYLILRTVVLGRLGGQERFIGGSVYAALLTMAKSALFYARLLLLPVGLCADHGFVPAGSVFEPAVALSLSAVSLALFSAVFLFGKNKAAFFFILWFFVTLLPVSNLVPLQEIVVAERFLYFAAIGFCVLFSLALLSLPEKPARVFAAIVLIFYSCLTVKRNGEWKDEFSFCKATIRENAASQRAYTSLGVAYVERGDYEKGIECYREAIRINPGYAVAYCDLGVAFCKLAKPEEGIPFLKKAVALSPSYAIAYRNLGVAYTDAGYPEKGIECLEKALVLSPQDALAHYNLALVYSETGDGESALKHYDILKELDRNLADNLFGMFEK